MSDAKLKFIADYAERRAAINHENGFEQSLEREQTMRPRKIYQNPAWRPHHNTIHYRPRPAKFTIEALDHALKTPDTVDTSA
jgi:hypothetical protein